MGYPIKSVDGSTTYTYTWTKGKLTGFSKFSSIGGRHSYTYTYDAYGKRTKKLYTFFPGAQASVVYAARVTTNYTYDLSVRLIKESVTEVYSDLSNSTRESVYLYDENSIVRVDFTQNGSTSTYYFDRNIKGDVIGIYNASGTKIANYSYDSWGNSKLTTLLSNNFSGYNPILYRGYYYDSDLGMYYLQSRYYDAKICRFISADSYTSTGQGILSVNMYAYCGNNPVMGYDPTGHWDLGGILVGVALVIISGVALYFGSWKTELGLSTTIAVMTTGIVMTYAAATDSAMVLDVSASYSLLLFYGKIGGSVVIDFGKDEAYAYGHRGNGVGYTRGISYSVGIVENFNDPSDYAGEFCDEFIGLISDMIIVGPQTKNIQVPLLLKQNQ